MKITELRLSSLFYPIDRSKEIHLPIETPFKVCTIGFKVEAISYDKVPAQVEKWTEFNPNDLSPIPLDDYWLDKLGFELLSIEGESYVNRKYPHIIIDILDSGVYGIKLRFPNGHLIDIEFTYVHELQNFYFAMTGEDLLTVGGRS